MILHGRTPMCAQVTCSKNLSPLFHEKSCLFFIFLVSSAPIRHYFPEPGQSVTTGFGEPSWESDPGQDLWPPPSLRFPLLKGAVTGRKYHYRLYRSLRNAPAMEHFQDRHFPLFTFDVILLTDTLTVCRWSWRVLLRRFALSRCTANVL